MRKHEKLFLTFFFFFVISGILLSVSKATGKGIPFLEPVISPLQLKFFQTVKAPSYWFSNPELVKLREENQLLRKELVGKEDLIKENSALKDQFQTSFPQSSQLLPATVIGAPYAPGNLVPEYLVINKGTTDGIHVGQAVVVKDNLVGKIQKTSQHIAVVTLVTNAASSFAAKTSSTNALGIVKGEGRDILLDAILLSETVEEGDSVVAKGDIKEDGTGYPPQLLVGKITSIDKKPSALFQTAQVKSLLDFNRLERVFVLTGYK